MSISDVIVTMVRQAMALAAAAAAVPAEGAKADVDTTPQSAPTITRAYIIGLVAFCSCGNVTLALLWSSEDAVELR